MNQDTITHSHVAESEVGPNSVEAVAESDRFSERSVEDLVNMLNTEYKVYSYITTDNEPGTIIVDPKLEVLFDDNKLFRMEDSRTKTIKLKDILEKGFVNVGSVDLIETLSIRYPHPVLQNDDSLKPLVKGMYLHGSRKRLIGEPTNIDFSYDPESDCETVDFVDPDDQIPAELSDQTIDQKPSSDPDLSWLCE